MTFLLYTHPSNYGRIARWMAEEVREGADVDYRSEVVDPSVPSLDFARVNPLGTVPAIVHGDHVVTEAAAICAYLADAFPAAMLAPPLEARAAYYRFLFTAAGPFERSVVNAGPGAEGSAHAQSVGDRPAAQMVALFDAHLSQHEFVCGKRFTAADVCVASQLDWHAQRGLLNATPALTDYVARMTARPAAAEAHRIDDAMAVEAAPVAAE